MLCNLLQKYGCLLTSPESNSEDDLDSTSSLSPSEKRQKNTLMGSYNLVMSCLCLMIQDHDLNIALFRKTFKGSLDDFLKHDETRWYALKLIQLLIEHQSNAETTPHNSAPSSSESSKSTEFSNLMEALQSAPRFHLRMKKDILKTLEKLLNNSLLLKDAFRNLGGFISLLSLLIGLEGALDLCPAIEGENTQHISEAAPSQQGNPRIQRSEVIALMQAVFSVFIAAMSDHPYNRWFFENHIGRSSLNDSLQLTGVFKEKGSCNRALGILLGAAVEDTSLFDIFEPDISDCIGDIENPNVNIDTYITERWNQMLSRASLGDLTIHNRSFILSIMHFLPTIEISVALLALFAIYITTIQNVQNRMLLNELGLVTTVMTILAESQKHLNLDASHYTLTSKLGNLWNKTLMSLAKSLIEVGLSTSETRFLLRSLNRNVPEKADEEKNATGGSDLAMQILELILYGVKYGRTPSCICFDSIHSSISLENLGDRLFPPMNGFTLMTWVQVFKFDATTNVHVLSLSDSDERSNLDIFIEGHSRNLVVETAPNQFVRFESFSFRDGVWYHLAVSHSKPRLSIIGSTLSMYIDGVLVDQYRSNYPSQPTSAANMKGFIGSKANSSRSAKVRSPSTYWNLGAFYLIEDVLDADGVNIAFNLGPRYSSNFQDDLGKYQTYEIIDSINLDMINKGSDNGLEKGHLIMDGVHLKTASGVQLTEDKIILALSAKNLHEEYVSTQYGFHSNSMEGVQTSQKIRAIINSGVPKISRALVAPEGLAYLRGNAYAVSSTSLSTSIFRVGGPTLLLKIVEKAQTAEGLHKAVAILVESIRFDWRHTSHMEKNHGYEILACILKQKKSLVTPKLVNLLLILVGETPFDPSESVIGNVQAYQQLFLDLEIWRSTSIPVQHAIIDQFYKFAVQSRKRTYNISHLTKLNIIRVLLVALKTDVFAEELLPELIEILTALAQISFTVDTIRLIGTFLVSTLPKEKGNFTSSTLLRRATITLPGDREHEETSIFSNIPKLVYDAKSMDVRITKNISIRNLVLEMLLQIVNDPENPQFISRFASTITSRWPLLFIESHLNSYTVVLATRLLARLLYTQGPVYVNKFRVASEGFAVLEKLLPEHWYLCQLYPAVISILLGVDIATVPIVSRFDLFNLLTVFKSEMNQSRPLCHEALSILFAMIKRCVDLLVKHSHKLEDKELLSFEHMEKIKSPTLEQKAMDKAARRRSKSFTNTDVSQYLAIVIEKSLLELAKVQQTLIHFLTEMYITSSVFKELCCKPNIIDQVVGILFPVICGSEEVTVDTELYSKDSNVTSEAEKVFDSHTSISVTSTSSEIKESIAQTQRPKKPYMNVLSSNKDKELSSEAKQKLSISTKLRSFSSPIVKPTLKRSDSTIQKNATIECILEFLVTLCVDSILKPVTKPLAELDLALRGFPPSFQEHQVQFETYLIIHVLSSLESTLQLSQNLLANIPVLTNISKFISMAVDATYQGWFVGGAEQLFSFCVFVLEMTTAMETSGVLKIHRLEALYSGLYKQLNRLILFRLSDHQVSNQFNSLIEILNDLIYNQKIILIEHNTDGEFFRCLTFHLSNFLNIPDDGVRIASLNLLKLLFLQKPNEMSSIIQVKIQQEEYQELADGFSKLLELEFGSFIPWMDSRKQEFQKFCQEHLMKSWDSYLAAEIKVSKDYLKISHGRRLNKLRRLARSKRSAMEVYQRYLVKAQAWSRSIQSLESNRLGKALQDCIDNDEFINAEWGYLSEQLYHQRAIWQSDDQANLNQRWKLDFTEGPCRMRMRLQLHRNYPKVAYKPKQSDAPINKAKKSDSFILLQEGLDSDKIEAITEADDFQIIASEISEEPAEFSSETSQSSHPETAEAILEEDKNYKISRILESGDTALDIYNISRILCLDAHEGLLIIGKTHIYIIDNYFQRKDGEIVDIWTVPAQERDIYLQTLSSNSENEDDAKKHQHRKWAFDDIKEVHKRKFLFRDVAIEVFLNDGRNYLITLELNQRDTVYNRLLARLTSLVSANESVAGTATHTDLTPLAIGSKLTNLIFGSSSLSELTSRWEKREISNFQYLMHLNTLAGRSYNDLTQYPIFPWILADYTSEELDLTDPKTFRDLSKPMGTQSAERANEFIERYNSWEEADNTTPAFHYGTHYSSAMIVCWYLIRLEPFTHFFLKLQGGYFDHADRLFHSIQHAWQSASQINMTDVRELIPEFFYLPEFLENRNGFNFGVKQGSGEAIDSVILPPWAHGDPKLFIKKHREALESEYTSSHLHEWIDLIFGYKQQGEESVKAVNVFHHLSYEDAVDLDSISDPVEKSATIGIIHNFGQTPRQLFKRPHPRRSLETSVGQFGNYKIHREPEMLNQSAAPIFEIGQPVGEIRVIQDRLMAASTQKAFVPPNGTKYVEWGFSDNSLRLFQTDTGKMLSVFENLHSGPIRCVAFADSSRLVIGGEDTLVSIWRIHQNKSQDTLELCQILRGHSAPVTCVAVSGSYSIVVTGSEDGTCIIWDLNRLNYIRQLSEHEQGVQALSINNTTGTIITCSGPTMKLWTVNGEPIATHSTSPFNEPILCCAFVEGRNHEWLEEELICTGHRKGLIKIWNTAVNQQEGSGSISLRYTLEHEDRLSINKGATSDIIVLNISSHHRTIYSGDSLGRVYGWLFPDAGGDLHWMKENHLEFCLNCRMKFSVLERKARCKQCGGIFCSSCVNTISSCPDKSARFCSKCSKKFQSSQ
ncbi:beach-domain-containing protein [Basidiobolus meristosporus CBS 931.73]|uniref:Beach-domain-containing protein n=1 Tax=Basidiobolus meristosporus CBS 931.73 TaxID=1314790 RepID=A0A1Y1XY04_9FUNG|nr:beach-domain-containing protein [Basidiobolus meristosporus CBS 931.73]|eukprot:ORX90609.1 beach-domain-containing protein [Basidiobolus meristosporus CBS 931.73]